MKVKDLIETLKQCSEDLEVNMFIKSHEHLYSSTNDELGCLDIKTIVPLNSITIKNDDGYGYVVLSNLRD